MALKREKLTAKTKLLIMNGQAPTCSFFPQAAQFSMSCIHDHGDCSKFEVPRLEKAMNIFEQTCGLNSELKRKQNILHGTGNLQVFNLTSN